MPDTWTTDPAMNADDMMTAEKASVVIDGIHGLRAISGNWTMAVSGVNTKPMADRCESAEEHRLPRLHPRQRVAVEQVDLAGQIEADDQIRQPGGEEDQHPGLHPPLHVAASGSGAPSGPVPWPESASSLPLVDRPWKVFSQ